MERIEKESVQKEPETSKISYTSLQKYWMVSMALDRVSHFCVTPELSLGLLHVL